MRDSMEERDMERDIKRLREEVSELRKVVNLLIGLMMEEEEEEFTVDEERSSGISGLYT